MFYPASNQDNCSLLIPGFHLMYGANVDRR